MINNILSFLFFIIKKLFPEKSIKLSFRINKLLDNVMVKIINNKKFVFYVKNFHCYKRYNSILYKEPVTIEWLNKIKSNQILWDIGANIGIYSLYAAIIKRANVFAFEPISNSSNVLLKNIELNCLQDKIKIFNFGLGNKNNLSKLFYVSNHAGSARHSYKKSKKFKYFENILILNPEYLINNKLLKMPNYVKIDTDGGEIEILKGLKKVLKSAKLKSICIENEYGRYEKQKKNKILNIMKQNRFKLKKIDNLNAGYNMFFYR